MKSAGILVLFLVLLISSPALAAEPPILQYQIELGGGLFVPIGDNNRDHFGTGADLNAGFAANLGWKSTWLVLDVAVIHSKGDDFVNDGTFEPSQSAYTVVPIAFGVRTSAASGGETMPVRLYLGAGFLTVITTYNPPYAESSSAPTFGAMVELRPEVSLGRRAGLYFRQRAMVMLDADYDAGLPTLNYSGITLDVGLTWRLR